MRQHATLIITAMILLCGTTATAQATSPHASNPNAAAVAADTCPWHARKVTVSKACLRAARSAQTGYHKSFGNKIDNAYRCKQERGWRRCNISADGEMKRALCKLKHPHQKPKFKRCAKKKIVRHVLLFPRSIKAMRQVRQQTYKRVSKLDAYTICRAHTRQRVIVKNVSCNQGAAIVARPESSGWDCATEGYRITCTNGDAVADRAIGRMVDRNYITTGLLHPSSLYGVEEIYGLAVKR